MSSRSVDLLVIGGGVIGLSIAYESLCAGMRVGIVDRGRVGREASWAGAGILSPVSEQPLELLPAYERLRTASFRRFPSLAEDLAEEAGIDIGFRRSGGVEIVRPGDALSRSDEHLARAALGIRSEPVRAERLAELEPNLARGMECVYWPDMCQVRNPRLVAGLFQACVRRGAVVVESDGVRDLEVTGNRADGVVLESGERLACGQVVLAAGAWSRGLLHAWSGISRPICPIQGEIVVFEIAEGEVRRIILDGKRYLVPREGGLLLVGATEEDVGFAKQVTASGAQSLRAFAMDLVPSLAGRCVRYAWAGLRPGSSLGSPIIGRVGEFANFWVATGHFRHGLQQSTGTARLIVDWVLGRESFVTQEEFGLDADRSGHVSAFAS